MSNFNKVIERKIAREIGGLLNQFDSPTKFKQQLNAIQMQKIRLVSLNKIKESEATLFKLKANKLKELF